MRRADWPTRLAGVVEGRRQLPFSWGAHDCCAFAAACVEAVTGIDHFAAWRGRYRSRMGAMRWIAEAGGLPVLVSRALGEPDLPGRAQRGDVVLIGTRAGFALGVCVGSTIACAGPQGVTFVPLNEGLQCWHV